MIDKRKFKFYNSKIKIILWCICIVIAFITCIIAFPGFIILWNTVVLPKIYINQSFNNDNFLSGLLGVLLGFIFDLLFINRLRKILKYNSLVLALTQELNSIIRAIFSVKSNEDFIVLWNKFFIIDNDKLIVLNTEYLEQLKTFSIEGKADGRKKIVLYPILKSIIISADYDLVFLKLNNKLHRNLHNIATVADMFNDEFNLHPEQREDNLKSLVESVGVFYAMTNKKIYKQLKKFINN